MNVRFLVVADGQAAAAAAATFLAEPARAGGDIVLAGGSTPRRAYELAAEMVRDWREATVWFGDERCVPADDPLSNQRLVQESLLDRLEAPPTVRGVRTELPAIEAAVDYDAALRGVSLDLVLLGLGPDGHTASLFPDAESLTVHDRLAVAAQPGITPFVERVTMTIPALAAAGHVVFLVVGADKAEAVARAFAQPPSPATPASLVRSAAGQTTAILDRAAAALLPGGLTAH